MSRARPFAPLTPLFRPRYRKEMLMSEAIYLQNLEWQALLVLYRHRERASSPLRFVGFKTTVSSLVRHQPPLAEWVGKPTDNQVHITDAGLALYLSSDYAK